MKELVADLLVLIACVLFVVNTLLINVHLGIYVIVFFLIKISYIIHKKNRGGNK